MEQRHSLAEVTATALTLFCGLDYGSPIKSELKFPSATTKPTEKEALAALARVLLMDERPPRDILRALATSVDFDEYRKCITLAQRAQRALCVEDGKATGKGPFVVLGSPGKPDYSNPDDWLSVAEHNYPDPDPDGLRAMSYRRLFFKNLNQGHHDPPRVFAIVALMHDLRGRGYTKAFEETAKRFGIGTDRVKKILASVKGKPWFDFSRGDGR
jgi:hypothetical protein